jgi:hypothetical protein
LTPPRNVTFGRRGALPAPPRPPAHPAPPRRPDPPRAGELVYEAPLRDSGEAQSDDESQMARFIGSDWPLYRDLWRLMKDDGALLPGFCFSAFSFSSAWLVYRRLYGPALAAVALELAATRLSPPGAAFVELLLCLAIGVFGKALVIRRGLATIGAARREGLPRGEAAARVERLGGTRLALAVAFSIFVGALGVAAFVGSAESPPSTDGVDPWQEITKAL